MPPTATQSPQRVLPPPPSRSSSLGLRSTRRLRQQRKKQQEQQQGSATEATKSSPNTSRPGAYRRAQTLDPEMIRTERERGDESLAWVSFDGGKTTSHTSSSNVEFDADALPVTSVTTTSPASPTVASAATDRSFDVATPPISVGDAHADSSERLFDGSPFSSSTAFVEPPPFTLSTTPSRSPVRSPPGSPLRTPLRNAANDDDAPRDAPADSPPATSGAVGGAGGGRSGTTPDWSDMSTWMRAPIDAITDAATTPILPPGFDNKNNKSNNAPSSTDDPLSLLQASSRSGGAASTILMPPKRPASGSTRTPPVIRPPRSSSTGLANSKSRAGPGTNSPVTHVTSSSSDEQSETGTTSTSSAEGTENGSSTSSGANVGVGGGGGVAERRRTAARSAHNATPTGLSGRSPRLARGRTASQGERATGNSSSGSAGASPARRPSMGTPSTPNRGRSSSRARGRPSTPGSATSRGRSASRGRGERTPSTPCSTRGRSVSRTRTTPSSRGRSRSQVRSTTPRIVPSSPSVQSTGGLSRSSTRGSGTKRGRSRSQSRSRSSTQFTSGSAKSTSRLSGEWNQVDLDDTSSVTSEPALRAGRSNLSRSRSTASSNSSTDVGTLNATNLQSLGQTETRGSGPASVSGAATPSSTRDKMNMNIRREGSFMEKLFGDTVSIEARRAYLPSRNLNISSNVSVVSGMTAAAQPEAVHTRTLLTASVYHNEATGLWIATINTNQKPGATNRRNAAKYLKAFSFHTEREARESAYANAPPKMLPFAESPNCFICRGKFAIFRRPSHCRNCGVCICNTCTTTWSSKMIPETYNMKKENAVKVCKSCNFLVLAFRRALLDGQYDEAIALYNTGNINLRCPFGNIKGKEIMYPIHCAAEGGNLDLLRWLVDVHYCPIRLISTGNKKPDKDNNTPIVTSKGRSVLNIAMAKKRLEMMRYLVTEKNVSVYEIKDLKTSLGALEATLKDHVSDGSDGFDLPPIGEDPVNFDLTDDLGLFDGNSSDFDDDSIPSDDGLGTSIPTANADGIEIENKQEMNNAVADACIICYDNSIDCVMTPCGHQICCLECSKNLNACPVCNTQGQFIRIFKP